MDNIRRKYLPEKGKKVLDIAGIKERVPERDNKNRVVLMAGGEGTRLRPLTNRIPKPMLKVGNKPILEIIIDQFKVHGFYDFVISINYLADIVEGYFGDGSNFGVNIDYVRETKSLGTAGCLRLLKEKLDNPFFVMNGDLLTKVNFEQMMKFHEENGYDITLGIRNYEYTVPYGVVMNEGDNITGFSEKPTLSYMINAGIYCLNTEVIDNIPADESFDITSLIDICIKKGAKIGSFLIKDYWVDIGQIEDYYRANSEYNYIFENGIESIDSMSLKRKVGRYWR